MKLKLISTISKIHIDSAHKTDKNYYPKAIPEEYKYEVKN